MQVDKISYNNYNNKAFGSKFIPNEYLNSAFNYAIKESDMHFYKSVKSIINDGKNRNLDISLIFDNGKYHMTTMKISDRPGGYWTSSENDASLSEIEKKCKDVLDVIKLFAKRELNPDAYVENLTKLEISKRLIELKREIIG